MDFFNTSHSNVIQRKNKKISFKNVSVIRVYLMNLFFFTMIIDFCFFTQ